MRRFTLERIDDVTGISGTGTVAEGVVFADGTTVLHWLTATASTGIYKSIDDVRMIHGHGGKTFVRYLDDEETPVCVFCRHEVTSTLDDPLAQISLCEVCRRILKTVYQLRERYP